MIGEFERIDERRILAGEGFIQLPERGAKVSRWVGSASGIRTTERHTLSVVTATQYVGIHLLIVGRVYATSSRWRPELAASPHGPGSNTIIGRLPLRHLQSGSAVSLQVRGLTQTIERASLLLLLDTVGLLYAVNGTV